MKNQRRPDADPRRTAVPATILPFALLLLVMAGCAGDKAGDGAAGADSTAAAAAADTAGAEADEPKREKAIKGRRRGRAPRRPGDPGLRRRRAAHHQDRRGPQPAR
ncbi:MAG: hypothetical protein IPM94_00005, partial [bacterium]|nr:hypothetical protein [bacterium]